jgi:DNA-damage-inducible protein J
MNSEVKAQLEAIYAKCGITLSDAFNIFMQQSLNTGGLPFQVVPDQNEARRKEAIRYLSFSYHKGLESVKNEGGWISADEVERLLEEDE